MAGFDDEIPAGDIDTMTSVPAEDMLPDVPLSAQTPVMSSASHDPEVAFCRRSRWKANRVCSAA